MLYLETSLFGWPVKNVIFRNSLDWPVKRRKKGNHTTNQIPELSARHSLWYELATKFCLDHTYQFLQLFWLYWIKKRSSRGCSLEHLESSGTKDDERTYYTPVMIRGPIIRQL